MKRKTKRLLSVLLTLALVLSFSSSALAEDSSTREGSINGDSTVTNPVFKFEVPSKVDFAFNAFEVGDAGSQITSADLFLANRSSIPVEVSFDYSVTVATGVAITADEASVDMEGANKEMYMTAVPAKDVAVNVSGTALTTTGAAITWSTSGAAISNTANKANITYVLAAATYTDANSDGMPQVEEFTSVDTAKSVAAFRFKGTINPDVEWEAGDATASIVYDIKGVTTTAYSGFTELTDMQNVKALSSFSSSAPANVAPTMADTSKTIAKTASNVTYNVNLGSGADAATSVTKVEMEYNGSWYALSDPEFDFSGTSLTLNKAGTYMTAAFGASKTYNLRATFNNTPVNAVKTFTLVVQ